MQTNEHINPDNLDDLLKDAFLDLNPDDATDSRLMDEVASSIYSREWPGGQAPAGTGKTPGKISTIKPWIWYLSSVLLLAILGYAAWAWLGNTSHETEEIADNTPPINSAVNQTNTLSSSGEAVSATTVALASLNQEQEQVSKVTEKSASNVPYTKEKNISKNNDTENTYNGTGYTTRTIIQSVSSKDDKQQVSNSNNTVVTASVTETHPTTESDLQNQAQKTDSMTVVTQTVSLLSPEELKAHEIKLSTMMGTMAGLKFDDYSFIHVDDPAANIKTEFYLKKYEVTIKEYKLFLDDLLAHGKSKEYEVARPKPELVWNDPKDKSSKKFLLQYLQKNTFENYPIICISKEGMEMYCSWIKQQIESYYKRNKNTISLDVRLPYLTEWKYAASAGKRSHKYGTANGRLKMLGWRTHYIANFAESQRKFVALDDTNATKPSDAQSVRTVNRYVFTTASSENSAVFHLNNMSGNVSEVVITPGENNVKIYRTIGGNWNSNKKFLKINAEDEFNGNISPSPFIGFRPVIMINK
ncbi:MAG: SUMF1/EgtB/PvdO family nonheme iron enzyme [Bacteroidetes bacterium]|nr:SUMF1/EgtB/PvdO family nonheme iron enzyme [Bacteroidota bacterium]